MALPATNLTLKFGEFDVDALLGPGSVTETYRAARAGGEPVALKLLRADRGGANPKVRAAFLAVAKRNKSLRLSGVAKIKEIHDGPDDVFVVSELCDGVNLEGLFESATATGSLDPALVGQIGIQIARILTRLHERREPILHGGLCPGNVVVTSGGRVTLLDLGFTASLRPLTEMPLERSWFAAPEIALDKAAPTVASDLYGLGAVLYYLLTGEPPVMGEDLEELAEVFEDGPPDVPGLPDWLHEAVFSLLAPDPEDRPRSAAAAALCLSAFPDGATRLGAIVNGNASGPIALPPASIQDPMAAHGTMVMSGTGQGPLALAPSGTSLGLSPGLADDELNPFDAPDSESRPSPLADQDASKAGRAAAMKPPSREQNVQPAGPLTLTPLRPVALTAPDSEDAPGPPALGLVNEPQWAADGNVGILSTEPQWVDDPGAPSGIALGSSHEPKWAAGPEALNNEPKWADAGASTVLPAAAISMPVDDFLDIGPPGGSGVLVAGLGAPEQQIGKVELPDLVDVDDGAMPSVVAASFDADTGLGAPQGLVSFGNSPASRAAASSVELGAIGFSDEDEDGAPASDNRGSSAGFVIPQVPRRAGSARRGEAAKKGSNAKVALVAAIVLAGGAALAIKALTRPERVLPSPQELAKKNGTPDPAQEKPKAGNIDEVAPPSRGELSIVTTPQGATIWVDGKERGRTPLTIQTTPGAHRIVIVKPGFKMLREVTDTSEGLTIKRTLPPANINFGGNVVLKVECKTSGKYPVFVDGKDTGLLCPIETLKIPGGNRLIGLYVIPDNKIWSFEREVVAGKKAHRVVFSY